VLDYISTLDRARRPPEGGARSLALLGSTGSIGRSTLEVLRLHPEKFHVRALAGARNITLLAAQAAEFRPEYLGLMAEEDIPRLRGLLPAGFCPVILSGREGYERIASLAETEMVLSAQTGAAGLRATYAAAAAGKIIALANKESLVLAGGVLRAACARSGAVILPVDSEHNAVFQCLAEGIAARQDGTGKARAGVSRLILTASGGPFWGKTGEFLKTASPEQALNHPTWSMGAKVTIDSATLMNKGLELIEASHLYGLPMSALEVVVHRESVVHSLVEFCDGAQLAQFGRPDMRIPIAYCLGFPHRLDSGLPGPDLPALGALTFARPDAENFPCLALARRAQERGRGCPVVLNAANEEAVAAFLARRLAFTSIPLIVERCLDEYWGRVAGKTEWKDGPASGNPEAARAMEKDAPDQYADAAGERAAIEEIFALDARARSQAQEIILSTRSGNSDSNLNPKLCL
jgi:1-deoxy-D-xylulose-5-phosphate reductoisomerase